jgi:hypothetical protein
MHGETADCERRVHGAQLIDVENHRQQNGRRESRMHDKTGQVVAHRDTGWGPNVCLSVPNLPPEHLIYHTSSEIG